MLKNICAIVLPTLLQKYNGFIYRLKGTRLKTGDEVTAELIVERKEIKTEN